MLAFKKDWMQDSSEKTRKKSEPHPPWVLNSDSDPNDWSISGSVTDTDVGISLQLFYRDMLAHDVNSDVTMQMWSIG